MAEPISIQQLKDASEDAITLADFIYKPANVMIPRRLAADINSLQYYLDYMSSYAQHSYETYDEMVANAPNLPNGVSAFVTNDLDTAKNGIYTYNGTSFVKGDYQPEKAAKDFVEAKLGGLQVFDGKVRAQDVSTADGSTQDVKNTEFRSELDVLPEFVGGKLADSVVSIMRYGIERTQADKNRETITPYDFGAIGDGVYHKLSEKYASLNNAKIKFPTAQSLDDSIDLVALESFFDYCQDNLVNANITLTAYVNRPLEIGMGAKGATFKTLVYNGDLTLTNTQTDVEIKHLMRINAHDTAWSGKLSFYGNGDAIVKDRKQLVGLILGDGGTDGSAGRMQIRSIIAKNFKCAGVVLANDCIFPCIDYIHAKRIGSISAMYYNADGSMGGHWDNSVGNHSATISARSDIAGEFEQRSVLTVSSLPPQYEISTEYGQRMVMFEGDELPYVIKEIDVANNTISVYPQLKDAGNTNYNRLAYIYGSGLVWQGNNSGAGAFNHLQFDACGIGFCGMSMFGANINFLSVEWCGVGLSLGRAYDPFMAYNINAAYFEANLWDYVQQWDCQYPVLKLGISNNFNINLVAEMQSYRSFDGTRLQSALSKTSMMIDYLDYQVNQKYVDKVDLSDASNVLQVLSSGGDLQLKVSNFKLNRFFNMQTKTIIISNPWTVIGDNITLKAPDGWTINGESSLTLYRKAEATIITVTILEANYWQNKALFVAGESIYRPSGTTAERPANAPVGYIYLDTTLAEGGKPIYKTTTGWVDSLGTVV